MKEKDESELAQVTIDFYEHGLENYFFLHDWLKMRPDERLQAIEKVKKIRVEKDS